ncbi:MAG: hypothetical protein LHW57_06515, partial [Candidatus Cloacimonetes bacterium]|nr:hypothetical protein [Candidatus Cloacimonadota bacterium]
MIRSFCLTVLCLSLGFCFAGEAPDSLQVMNITAFSKLWGYAKHFCPADEIQEIDWDRFAVYGSDQVQNAQNLEELRQIIMELFRPMVPGLALWTDNKPELPALHPVPGRKSAFWQYEGYNNVQGPSVYRSIRANRPHRISKDPDNPYSWGSLQPQIALDSAFDAKIRVSFRYRQAVVDTAYVYLGVAGISREDSLSGADWSDRSYELDLDNGQDARLWLAFSTEGCLYLEQLRLESWRDEAWQEIFRSDFTQDQIGAMPAGFSVNLAYENGGVGQNMDVLVEEVEGEKVLAIRKSVSEADFTLGCIDRIFAEEPAPGERLEKDLAPGLHFSFPLILSCDMDHTYPVLDPAALAALKEEYAAVDLQDRSDPGVWLAGIIRYWNELNFFYPYFEYNICDWNQELESSLARVLNCRDFAGYKLALRLLMSQTHDGHAYLVDAEDQHKRPGFSTVPLDGSWLVDKVLDEDLYIPLGSRITHMNGEDFSKLMQSNLPYHSLSNPETAGLRLFGNYLKSYRDSLATFGFVTPEGETIERITPLKHFGGPQWIVPEAKFVQYPDSILYVNTNIITEQELLEMLPELLEAKGIILDLRYYPRIRLSLLTHLLTQQDSLSNCLIKRYVRPDEELPRPGEGEPTWGLEPAEPHIGAKVVALSSRNSQSY